MDKKDWTIGVHMTDGKLAVLNITGETKDRVELKVTSILLHGIKDATESGITYFYPPHRINMVTLEDVKEVTEEDKVDESATADKPASKRSKRAGKK